MTSSPAIARPGLARLLAGVSAVALLAAACGPSGQTAPTTAPAKPTSPATSAAASPVAAPSPGTAASPAAAASPSAAGQPGAAPAASGQRGGTLRIGTGALPKVLHPSVESQQYTNAWSYENSIIWASLLDIDWDKMEFRVDPRTSIAREMPKVGPDGRTFTFTIRDDAKWSDGKPITSADFLFNWQNVSKEENNWIGFSSTVDRIESFTTPDAKTIQVVLKEKLAPFLALSLINDIYPVPQHVWQGKPWLDPTGNPEVLKPTVVAGPYMPKDITADRHTFVRNPNWWGKQPNLDEIHYVMGAPNTLIELLRTRQVDMVPAFPSAQFEDAKKVNTANTIDWPAVTGSYRLMQFNVARPNMDKKEFRQALAYAINREDLVQFENNLATPQFGFFPNESRWVNNNVEKYQFDLNKARQLLQQAGFQLQGGTLRGANGQPVRLEVLWPTSSPARGNMATYAQQQWKELGIETNVSGLEFNAFVDRYQRQKDFDVAMGSFVGGSGDPDNAKSQLSTGGSQNATQYSNARVDELFNQGAQEQDDARRKQIYDEIQKLALDDLPQYYLVTLTSFSAYDKKVQGVSPRKGGDLITQNNAQFLDWSITP